MSVNHGDNDWQRILYLQARPARTGIGAHPYTVEHGMQTPVPEQPGVNRQELQPNQDNSSQITDALDDDADEFGNITLWDANELAGIIPDFGIVDDDTVPELVDSFECVVSFKPHG